jgi:capsular polysaccharide biosynthesis protein
MDENAQTQDEISLVYIFKLLLRKIKLLVIVLLIGAFVGAGLGVLRTFNKKEYGTTIEFYVNPRLDKSSSTEVESQYGVYGAYGRHVMDNMVKLLSSELFAEQMLLDKETGLPKTGENADVDAKTAIALKAQKEANVKITDAETALKNLNEANIDYRKATTELNTLWQGYMNLNDKLNSTPTKGLYADVDVKIQAQEDAKKAVTDAEDFLKTAEDVAADARKDAEEKKKDALELWRNTYATYSKDLDMVLDCISYSYYDESSDENVSDLARSFIYVKIAVMNNEDLAKEYYARIIELVPQFVETNMAVPSGYDGTNCQRITRSDKVDRTNADLMVKTSIKYGLLLAAAALVVACVVVIIIDRSDKRLRNVEQITETFNIPVLGVIPTIQKEEEETAEKQTSTEVQK